MTEGIIIDGVDVAGCKDFLELDGCDNTDTLSMTCSRNNNCYYKQLKRLKQQHNDDTEEIAKLGLDVTILEQENRELKAYKDVNEDFKKAWDELNKKYTEVLKLAKENADSNEYCLQELEKENKELKEINTALIQEAEDIAEARMEICNQCGNRDDYNIPCKMIRDLDYGLNITIEERDTYRSALEEIKTILDKECGVIANAKAVGIINEVLQ